MYKISEEFKKQVFTPGKMKDTIIEVWNNNLTVGKISIISVKEFNNISIKQLSDTTKLVTSKIIYKFQGMLYKTIMRELDFEAKGNISLIDKTLHFKNGLKVNGKFEYVDYGNFKVKDIEEVREKETIKVTAYDNMLNFMVDFDFSKLNISLPCTVLDFSKALSNYCGVQLYTEQFFNNDILIDEDFFTVQKMTCRDVLEKLAQVTLCTIFIKENKLYFSNINKTDEVLDINVLKSLRLENKFGPVNSFVLGRGDVEDNVYDNDQESINTNGLCEIRFDENDILDSKREQVITGMFNQIKGLEYYPFEAKEVGLCYLEPCDLIIAKDRQKNEYKCLVLNLELIITSGTTETISAETPNESTTEYKYATKEEKKTLKVERIAKKNEGKILDLVKETGNHEERINQIETNTEGLLLRAEKNIDLMSIAEGNNLTINALEDKATVVIKGNTEYKNYININNMIDDYEIFKSDKGIKLVNNEDTEEPYLMKTSIDDYPIETNSSYTLKASLGEHTTSIISIYIFLGNFPEQKIVKLDLTSNNEVQIDTEKFNTFDLWFELDKGYANIEDISLTNNSGEIISLMENDNFIFNIKDDNNAQKVYILTNNTPLHRLNDVYDEISEDGIIRRLRVKDENATKIEDMLEILEIEVHEELTEEQKNIFNSIKTFKGNNKVYHSSAVNPSQFIFKYFENTDNTEIQQDVAELKVKNNEISTEVKKKVGEDEIVSKINQSAEAVGINADKIELSAEDILNLISGNTINLSGKKIKISSNNFNVDENGNVIIGGDQDSPALIARDTTINAKTSLFPLGIMNEVNNSYTAIMKGGLGAGKVNGDEMEETVTIDYTGIRTPSITQTSLEEIKKNFELLENAMDIIKNTDIYKYNLKTQANGEKKHIGFVIGEKYKHSKEISSEDKEGNEIGADIYSMVSVCFKAIRELSEEIENLKEKGE